MNNLIIYLYEGNVYSDKNCTQKVGTIFIEQIVNTITGATKTIHNVNLQDGVISYVLFHTTNDDFATDDIIGPFNYGTKIFILEFFKIFY